MPAKYLSSKRVQNSLRASILPLVSLSSPYFAFTFTWKLCLFLQFFNLLVSKRVSSFLTRLKEIHLSLLAEHQSKRIGIKIVENLVSNKCMRMDEVRSKLYGVQFFFSSVTRTKNNAKEKKLEKIKKQPSLEKTTEDKEDSKEYLDEFFRNFYTGVYSHQRMQIQIPFLYCFIISITMLKSKQLIQGLKAVRTKILRPKK